MCRHKEVNDPNRIGCMLVCMLYAFVHVFFPSYASVIFSVYLFYFILFLVKHWFNLIISFNLSLFTY